MIHAAVAAYYTIFLYMLSSQNVYEMDIIQWYAKWIQWKP